MKIYDYSGRANISGDRIHQARTAQRLSQDVLAAKMQVYGVGLGREAISRIETGDRFVTGECADKCIYITAFESNDAFRNCKEDLAWETEVWIVTNPDHMIHRNGFRFIGPYGETTE